MLIIGLIFNGKIQNCESVKGWCMRLDEGWKTEKKNKTKTVETVYFWLSRKYFPERNLVEEKTYVSMWARLELWYSISK